MVENLMGGVDNTLGTMVNHVIEVLIYKIGKDKFSLTILVGISSSCDAFKTSNFVISLKTFSFVI